MFKDASKDILLSGSDAARSRNQLLGMITVFNWLSVISFLLI